MLLQTQIQLNKQKEKMLKPKEQKEAVVYLNSNPQNEACFWKLEFAPNFTAGKNFLSDPVQI